MEMDFEGIKKTIDAEREAVKTKVGELETQQREISKQLIEYTGRLGKLDAAKAGLDGKASETVYRHVTSRKRAGLFLGKQGTQRIRRSDEQIIKILKDADTRGLKVTEIAEEQGVTPLSVYNWKKKRAKAKAGLKSKKK